MKKILLVLVLILFTTACVRIDKTDIEDMASAILGSKIEIYNHSNSGFKYYLPRDLQSVKRDEYNEILKSKKYEYYLYVDLVSYFNKTDIEYKKNDTIRYSLVLNDDKKKGIINVIDKEDKYLVEVVYNYARVQVLVDELDIKNAISKALIITSSIRYNDDVIKKLLEESEFTSNDEIVNIFDKKDDKNDSLGVVDDITGDNDYKNKIDPDYIR